jgi:hypothetical protein
MLNKPKSRINYFLKSLRYRGGGKMDLPWQGWHVIQNIYKDVDLPKMGVNNMPFHLSMIQAKWASC